MGGSSQPSSVMAYLWHLMIHVLASFYEMTTKWLGHLSSTGPAYARALSLRVWSSLPRNNPWIERTRPYNLRVLAF